jgi:hypothetical protein
VANLEVAAFPSWRRSSVKLPITILPGEKRKKKKMDGVSGETTIQTGISE